VFRRWSRKLPDRCGNVGFRCQLRYELFDLAFGFEGRTSQHFVAILFREMGREPLDPAQVQTAFTQHGQEHGMLPRRPCDGDAKVSLGLGQMEHLDAVGDHGRAGLASVEPALVYFTDVSDQRRLDPA
jgi:hypothetical protein